jgi:hypothetical protein
MKLNCKNIRTNGLVACRPVVRRFSSVPSFLAPVNSRSEMGHKGFRKSRGVKLIFYGLFFLKELNFF